MNKIPNLELEKSSMVVQKSNPLQSLAKTSMTLPELKILDAYLSKINSRDIESRCVKLGKGELENLLGVTRILKEDLSIRLKNLFQVIEIKDKHKKNGFSLISLFEKANSTQDEYGLWQVELTCTSSAREYIFNIDNIGYLKYRLSSVINLTSRYSYILYLYLEDNRFRRTWDVELSELKDILNSHAERYTQFKFFNSDILKKCQKELLNKTECNFTYEPIKKGRKVVAIRFSIEQLSQNNQINTPKKICDDSHLSFLAEACNNEFSLLQMEDIFAIISTMNIEPYTGDIDLGRYHFLREKYATLNVADEKNSLNGKPISHRFNYFKKLLTRKDTD